MNGKRDGLGHERRRSNRNANRRISHSSHASSPSPQEQNFQNPHSTDPLLEELLQQIHELMDAQNFEIALLRCKEVVENKPNCGLAHLLMGDCYLAMGCCDDARYSYRLALRADSPLFQAAARLQSLEEKEKKGGPGECKIFAEKIEGEIMDFLEKYVGSPTHWDIIVFFYRNPALMASARRLAAFLGKSEQKIKSVLAKLCELDLLMENNIFPIPLYTFDPKQELKEKLDMVMQAREDFGTRWQITHYLLQKAET
ncbi:hypothetical protein HKBW3S03_01594 [Candidatus Hakubella thermalkaliphila]|nr:hypothetical protein [Candidatus Hakubella thermalkaliphila]GFP20091.1 hypothetical protein HKBW3S03_01594 [Candidatus Hakubella thermalkaliphila]GFP23338.1 hypothetical protein HKBW3S09_00805 [Candidatus Hakubella thermalkaliphila]